ncbi:MFS transporter [Diaminobutyricibacter tongyongensis]|uniref:MFS transporter n=1 Tax=Leifsonia tongyongensis TaxID=1268043 RepID=A0A6L9XVW0_9MICO|nr:MFS transporter [Diaminobutyricibacter tongyongensis]NEN05523.1 MFS transporter [Diaminobutyricibacter tongyongensis]
MSQSTPAHTTRSRRELSAWRNAVFVIFILSGLSLATWVARVPGVRDGLGLDTAQVGLLILGMSVGAILGLVASAPLLAKVGPHRGMVISLGVVAAGMVLIGSGVSFIHFVPVVGFGLALLGFGNGMVDVMMNVEGAAVEREIGKTLMPLMHACFSLGTVVGAGIGAAAAALHVDVSWHLMGIAVLVIGVAIVAVRFIPNEVELGDPEAGVPEKRPWGERLRENLSVWADWRLILIGVVMLGMAFAEGSANDWLALGVVDGHHQSNATGALVFGFFVAAMTVGRILGGPLVDRIGRTNSIRLTAGLGVLGLLLFILGGPLWLVVVGTVLWGFGVSLGFPLGMSAAADGTDKPAARVSAVAMIGYCAFLVGPPLIGFLGQAFGILNALYVLLVLMVASALAAPAVREASRARAPRVRAEA